METRSISLPVLYFGTPVALVSSLSPDGTANLSPISSYWALSDTLLIGLSNTGQCCRNLQRCKELVLNLPDASLWTNVEAIAAMSGAEAMPDAKRTMGYRFERDKFKCAGLTAKASECVAPMRAAECPIQIEAGVIRFHEIGKEADALIAVVVKALRIHSELLTISDRISLDRRHPLYYVFRQYFSPGQHLWKNFRGQLSVVSLICALTPRDVVDESQTFNAMQTNLNPASTFAKPRMPKCLKPGTALIGPLGGSTIDLRLRICAPAFLAVQIVMRGCRARVLSGID
ncbi:flavin reductase family protein [Burkholderia cepacia]|nr:flavin reductase family protein [Burkholderia cepacia]QFS42267.1 Flavin reductase like domai [Burkholderia cepacia]